RGLSRVRVRVQVAEGGSVDYLPQATVVTAGADHRAQLSVDLAADSRARCREVLVLGRWQEKAGRLVASTHAIRDGIPLLRQEIDLGEALLRSSSSALAGARVLATEFIATEQNPPRAASGPWWSLSPLAAGGALASTLAPDAATTEHRLSEALSHHPDAKTFADHTW
ncbi:MAG: urease accessory protein UreD, partial [Saccharopolyspora sp.]|uniref:urease accessory protein UreD n=1 Tax=Saccharopolyspora sp. TaxID=33915 RepID=UPI0025E3BA48